MNNENDLMPSVSPATTSNRHSRNVKVSTELMHVSPFASDVPKDSEEMILHLLQKHELLEMEKNNIAAEIESKSSGTSHIINSMPEDQLKELYEELKENLLRKTVVHDRQELMNKQKCLNQTAMSILHPITSQDSLSYDRKRELENLMDQYVTVTSQVAKAHQEFMAVEEDLEKIKKENFELLQKTRTLYVDIGDKKKAKEEELIALTKNKDGKSIHEQLQSKLQLNTIQNNTLQMLILGSGINWAQDDKINKLMLEASKNLPL
ncbi:hypothetical protein ACF0H5_013688 [Mactra antiquata]